VGLLVELLPAGPAFKDNLIKLWRPMIIKGVPSTINDNCYMYKDPAKVKIIGEVIQGMCECMENEMCLDPSDMEELDPTVQLWLYYFNSQHQLRIGNIDEALSYINKAIAHTPTVVELYTHKAKIMQFAGN
jgi:N-alpha-acetyltransferase 15/16, NatA auxiliary subunit